MGLLSQFEYTTDQLFAEFTARAEATSTLDVASFSADRATVTVDAMPVGVDEEDFLYQVVVFGTPRIFRVVYAADVLAKTITWRTPLPAAYVNEVTEITLKSGPLAGATFREGGGADTQRSIALSLYVVQEEEQAMGRGRYRFREQLVGGLRVQRRGPSPTDYQVRVGTDETYADAKTDFYYLREQCREVLREGLYGVAGCRRPMLEQERVSQWRDDNRWWWQSDTMFTYTEGT